MPEILTLLSCLTFELNNTSLKHLSCIIMRNVSDEWPSNNALGYPAGEEKEGVIELFSDFSTAPRTGRR